jgi:hypothetical protein
MCVLLGWGGRSEFFLPQRSCVAGGSGAARARNDRDAHSLRNTEFKCTPSTGRGKKENGENVCIGWNVLRARMYRSECNRNTRSTLQRDSGS